MKKIYYLAIACAIVLTSGCLEGEPSISPTETVYEFTSAFESNSYDTCYQMMTDDYKDANSLKSFIEECKASDRDEYQLIAIENEYIDNDIAIVDIQYNVTGKHYNITEISWSGIKTEMVTETKEGVVELVKENSEWSFNTFPETII